MPDYLRAAAYCRVSTDREDQANSLASQRQYFADYIKNRQGWLLFNVYFDEGISGTQTKNRAGFHSMIADAAQGKIDLILTKEVSRFARNTVDTLSYTRKLKELGIGVIFTIDNIDTRDSDGELRLTIMASIAQEESRKTSERVKWGQKRRMEQGIVFGRDLLGYTVENGKLSVNEAEVPAVRAIFHKFTTEHKGTHVIARELLSEGICPKYADQWSNASILRILKNEKYAGDLYQKKTITPDYLTHKKIPNHKHEDMVCLSDHHTPIIDRELWNRTQEELRLRSHITKEKSRYSSRYWCSGKLFCGVCGHRYVSRTGKRKDGTISHSWRCSEAAAHGFRKTDSLNSPIGCSNPSINEQALLTCMQSCLREVFAAIGKAKTESFQKEILKEIQTLPRPFQPIPDTPNIEKEILHLQTKKRKITDLYLDGLITKDDLKQQNLWYDKKLTDLKHTLNTSHKNNDISDSPFSYTDLIMDCQAALTEILDFSKPSAPFLETPFPLSLYQELLSKIILYPDKSLHLWLNGLPFTFHLKIQTHGKQDRFTTDILHMEILPQNRTFQNQSQNYPVSICSPPPR